jgi:hypothetical protein
MGESRPWPGMSSSPFGAFATLLLIVMRLNNFPILMLIFYYLRSIQLLIWVGALTLVQQCIDNA